MTNRLCKSEREALYTDRLLSQRKRWRWHIRGVINEGCVQKPILTVGVQALFKVYELMAKQRGRQINRARMGPTLDDCRNDKIWR